MCNTYEVCKKLDECFIVVHVPVLDILKFLWTSSVCVASTADSQTHFAHSSVTTGYKCTISRYVATGVQEVQIYQQI